MVIIAWTLKYGATNSNGINSVSPQVDYSQNTQSLKASYLDKNVDNDNQTIDLTKFKTGSGTVLVVRKCQNQISEASKSALKFVVAIFVRQVPELEQRLLIVKMRKLGNLDRAVV